eukprot:NODE_1400_length_875_cov_77.033422_g1354_i0.p1 GENE.NODE_1400_length_875_cov_77.033422_g1354_i0~~NODE_1400_length_875_cov_77.033422_g1354_i0.p1  ORF type:complete len:255 (+),score=69.56 NODE_1400_length_875_cov_77.033422_g1354_i0:65-829(+)
MPAKKPASKKPAAKGAKKGAPKKEESRVRVFEPRPRNYGLGNDIPPKREVTRFVRWPKYIVMQRQKRVLSRRLKVPPAVNIFRRTLDSHSRKELFQLAAKYKPESVKERKARLQGDASAKSKNKSAKTSARKAELKCGIQRVTKLIEAKRAKLVLIAHDVDPIELVLWLPSLCKANDVPYAIVKGRAALGKLVGFKTATCAAFVNIEAADQGKFGSLVEVCNSTFNEKYEDSRKQWGGMQMGRKAVKMAKKQAK